MTKRKQQQWSDRDLLPREDVHKLLLSTPAHFTGEFRLPMRGAPRLIDVTEKSPEDACREVRSDGY